MKNKEKYINTWIKAAVEHVVVEIEYTSHRTKKEKTRRLVEPDYIEINRVNGRLWATFCRLRGKGPRCFMLDSMESMKVTNEKFEPSSSGRWIELIPIYDERGLKNKSFEELIA